MDVEVMRTGTWVDSVGRSHTYTTEDLDRIAAAYETRQNDAPVVIGHPKTNDPAYGWVESLIRTGDRLVAKLKDMVPTFVDWVKQKMYKYISVSLDGDNLRHVGFLGAAAPGIEGLAPAMFSCGDEDVVIQFSASDDTGLKELEHLRDENRELKQALDKLNADQRNAASQSFVASLVESGQILPRQKDQVAKLLADIDSLPTTDHAADEGPQKQLREFLSGLPKQVLTKELTATAGKADYETQVQDLMKTKGITYSAAVKRLRKEEE